jgi:hypothetical protein
MFPAHYTGVDVKQPAQRGQALAQIRRRHRIWVALESRIREGHFGRARHLDRHLSESPFFTFRVFVNSYVPLPGYQNK